MQLTLEGTDGEPGKRDKIHRPNPATRRYKTQEKKLVEDYDKGRFEFKIWYEEPLAPAPGTQKSVSPSLVDKAAWAIMRSMPDSARARAYFPETPQDTDT
jgi:hypothetical protein